MGDIKIKYMQYIDYLWHKYKEYQETAEQHMFVHLIMYDSKLIPAYNDLQENYSKEHAEIFINIMHKVLKFLGVKFTSLNAYYINNSFMEENKMRIAHDYRNKFDMSILEGKIVMAFTDPLDVLVEDYTKDMEPDNYKYFTDNFTGEGIHGYYVFDTPEEFISTWKEIYNRPNGMWYWVLDNGKCICSGACDPDDIEIFEDYFNCE